MMTDKLEKYIEANRSSFDDLTPSADIWSKISENTRKKRGLNRKLVIYRISSGVAATFILGLLGYIYFFTPTPQQNSLSDFQKEILETEQYYKGKVSQKKQEVFKLTSNKPEIKIDIEAELAILDTAMIELKNDLKENISNAEVVEAMIQNYRMKLQILEDILIYLEPKQKEDTSSEFTNI